MIAVTNALVRRRFFGERENSFSHFCILLEFLWAIHFAVRRGKREGTTPKWSLCSANLETSGSEVVVLSTSFHNKTKEITKAFAVESGVNPFLHYGSGHSEVAIETLKFGK